MTTSDRPLLSVVVPVLNEADSLRELHAQIVSVLGDGTSVLEALQSAGALQNDRYKYGAVEMHGGSAPTWELWFVDDGSKDTSWQTIQELARVDSRVRGLRFRRNFGKAAALSAAFSAAQGEWFAMLDADLQDDPAELPALLQCASTGFEVVNGWKQRRLDPWHKVYPSWVFNSLVSWLTGVRLHDHNCGLKVLHRSVAGEVRLYGELHRFIAVLAAARGFRVTEQVVQHRPRQFGHSKYGFSRFARGFLDLLTVKFLTGYGQRPLHLLGGTGLLLLLAGGCGLTWLALSWVMMNLLGVWPAMPIGPRPLLAYSLALTLLGGQVLSLGLLAELIVYCLGRPHDAYSVAERTSSEE